jgi:DNA mismatch repair protein MutS2
MLAYAMMRNESAEAALFAAELGSAPTLDLHGMRPDEARHRLDEFLHTNFMRGEPAVRIVHGRGTDTLRRMTETLLKQHPVVDAWRGSTRTHEAGAVTYAALSKRS